MNSTAILLESDAGPASDFIYAPPTDPHCADYAVVYETLHALTNASFRPRFHGCLPLCNSCDTQINPQSKEFTKISLGIVLPIIGLLGLVGNSFNAFVYSRRECRTSTNLYLCALACSDSGLILTSFFIFSLTTWRLEQVSPVVDMVIGTLHPVVYPMGHMMQVTSVYVTIAAGADCFIHTCLPECVSAYVRRPVVVRNVIISVLVFSTLYNIPHFFESLVVDCWHENFQQTLLHVCPDPFRFNKEYSEAYYTYMYTIFVAVGPLVLLILMNISIISFSVFASSSSAGSNMSDNIALILVVVLFILCNTVALLLSAMEDFIYANFEDVFSQMVDMSNVLVVFNSSFNFIIYYTFSQQFRRTFNDLMSCPIRGSRHHRINFGGVHQTSMVDPETCTPHSEKISTASENGMQPLMVSNGHSTAVLVKDKHSHFTSLFGQKEVLI